MSENALFKRASTRLALMGIMSALIAVTTTLAIPMPPPLTAITLAPIAIFVTGILMGPWIGLVASAIGSGIGFMAGASIGTIAPPPGYLYVFLVGIIIARAPMGFMVGFLRKVNEIVAMTDGVVIETVIFFVSDWYLFTFEAAVTFTLWTLVDLIYVPITLGILKGLRKALNTTYLL